MSDEMSVIDLRGFPKRGAGRPKTHTEPRSRINVEITTSVISDLDVVASAMGYTRTEALEEGAKMWLEKVGGMTKYR